MSIALWVLQWLLAAFFLMIGAGKIARPYESMRADERLQWVERFSPGAVKWIGLAEVVAAVGLVAPGLLGIGTLVTSLAAVGLAMLMAGAITVHIRRREPHMAALPSVLLAVIAFLTVGRLLWAPLG